MSKQLGRIEAFGEAMDECLKSADRSAGSVGARNCMEIRSAISDLWAAAVVVDDAKRAADQAHRERIHAEIAADMAMVCGGGYVKPTLDAIAAGRIRHLTINY